MLVTYSYKGEEYYDINGVMILSRLSKSQSKKIMKDYIVGTITYLNRNLYSKRDVVEFCNLINLRDEVTLRLMNQRSEEEKEEEKEEEG